MLLSLSKRASLIAQSEIRAMTLECARVGGINLAQGVCDTELPLPVGQGAKEAIDAGINSYTRYDGLKELRYAIADKMKDYNGIDTDPESEIIVSAGSTGAFYCACLALLNPGDEVILFEPYYGYHINTILAAEAVPTYVSLKAPDWTFSPEDLERVVTPRTKGIMINTKDKAMFILEKAGVASVPDEAFFHKPGSSQFVRFCFAKEDNELNEACRRLEALGS